MKVFFMITVLSFLITIPAIAQDTANETEYYVYMQKFLDMGLQLQSMKYKGKDELINYFQDWRQKYSNLSSEFNKRRLGIYNKKSYNVVRFLLSKNLSTCGSNLLHDSIEEQTSRFKGGKPYTGKNFEEFKKHLDIYFENLEKLKTAIAEKN